MLLGMVTVGSWPISTFTVTIPTGFVNVMA